MRSLLLSALLLSVASGARAHPLAPTKQDIQKMSCPELQMKLHVVNPQYRPAISAELHKRCEVTPLVKTVPAFAPAPAPAPAPKPELTEAQKKYECEAVAQNLKNAKTPMAKTPQEQRWKDLGCEGLLAPRKG